MILGEDERAQVADLTGEPAHERGIAQAVDGADPAAALQDGQVVTMLCQWTEPLGQIVTIKVRINGLLTLLTLHRLLIKTRWNTDAGPQTVAPVHEDKS